VWQGVKQPAIDIGFVTNITAVPVAVWALTGLLFDKHAPFATIWQSAGDDLVRERAHEWRKGSPEDSYVPPFIPVSAQGSREPEFQSHGIRQQRNRRFQDETSCNSFSHGSTGSRSSNHWSTSANASQAQGARSCTSAMAGQIMRLAKRAYSAVSNRKFKFCADGSHQPARDVCSRYKSKTHDRS